MRGTASERRYSVLPGSVFQTLGFEVMATVGYAEYRLPTVMEIPSRWDEEKRGTKRQLSGVAQDMPRLGIATA